MTDIVDRLNRGYSAGLRMLAADLKENEQTLDMARAEIVRLREALTFYADKKNYGVTVNGVGMEFCDMDHGYRARTALGISNE